MVERRDVLRAGGGLLGTAALATAAGCAPPTGTPAGVGSFSAGDVIEVEITGLGILRNTARDA